MDIAQYDADVAEVARSNEFILVIHQNAHLRERQKDAARFYFAMQGVLPRRVWSCPVLAGAILTMMCSNSEVAGAVLSLEAQQWARALGGAKL